MEEHCNAGCETHQFKHFPDQWVFQEKLSFQRKEALVFSQEHGAGGMAFTTWTGNGKVCQACTEAQEFVRELKR